MTAKPSSKYRPKKIDAVRLSIEKISIEVIDFSVFAVTERIPPIQTCY